VNSGRRARRRYYARDSRGRFNGRLQRLVDAEMVTPSRISEYADLDPAGIELGEEIHCRWVHPQPSYDTSPADLYVIDWLWWGDHTGDDVSRSNHRSLARDFPDQFVHLFDAYDAHGAALLPGFADDGLTAALLGLRDYALYDEHDNGALILELADEAWDAYLKHDVRAVLRDDHDVDTDELGISDDALGETFYRIYSDHYGDEHAENAVSVVFPSLDQALTDLAAALRPRTSS